MNNNIKLATALTAILACTAPSINCENKDSEAGKLRAENATLKKEAENTRLRKRLADLQKANKKKVHKSVDAGTPLPSKTAPKPSVPSTDAGAKPDSQKFTQSECRRIREKLRAEYSLLLKRIDSGKALGPENITLMKEKERKKELLLKLEMLNEKICPPSDNQSSEMKRFNKLFKNSANLPSKKVIKKRADAILKSLYE